MLLPRPPAEVLLLEAAAHNGKHDLLSSVIGAIVSHRRPQLLLLRIPIWLFRHVLATGLARVAAVRALAFKHIEWPILPLCIFENFAILQRPLLDLRKCVEALGVHLHRCLRAELWRQQVDKCHSAGLIRWNCTTVLDHEPTITCPILQLALEVVDGRRWLGIVDQCKQPLPHQGLILVDGFG